MIPSSIVYSSFEIRSNDIPPHQVLSHVVPVHILLLQIGGSLWTLRYVLFAAALNIVYEIVFAFLLIAEFVTEKFVFTAWLGYQLWHST